MSALAFNRREVKAERIYFIPVGTVIAAGGGAEGSPTSITVAKALWPDNTPATNISDFQIHEITTLKAERETESETFLIPSDTDGYTEDLDETLKSASWTAETPRTNALVKMLEYGLATLPVAGTAQIPFARKENYVEGLLVKETQVRGVAVTEKMWIWARVYLVTPGDSSSKTSIVQLRFRKMDSSLNSFVMVS
jgi:hypothetical protein